MPDYFSHGVAAEVIYEKLDIKYKRLISSKPLYTVGAQGGDIFFAYSVTPTKNNLGRALHNTDAVELFKKLIKGNLSYCAGFATHYALDSVLHPYVYDFETTKRSPLTHVNFENDLGLYISRKYQTPRNIIPKDVLLSCTGAVYDSVKHLEPLVTVTGVERCLKRYFTYSRFLFKTKRQKYKLDYDFSTLDEDIEQAIETGLKACECILKGEVPQEIFSKSFLEKLSE